MISHQKGDVFGSTSFGRSVRHSPPEHHVDIPDGPIDGVQIVLARSECFGTCPSYRVELRGNGEVQYHGAGFVTFGGDHQTRVSLEEAIDQAASTDAWIKGNDRTIPALEAEYFDFHSRAAADLLASAAHDAPDGVVYALLDHGAPLDGLTREGAMGPRMSAVEAAAMNGRLELMRRLIAAGAFEKAGKPLVSATLRASVASQRADVVAEILKYRPDVNSADKHGDTALALIFTGAHPHADEKDPPDEDAAIIRMLGEAGTNPNLPNSKQKSLVELAYSKEDKDALIAIGAQPEK